MYDLEIPFHRLVHHFITRIFYGAGEGDELQFGIPALLGLLSTPAAFGAITLLNKYSTLVLYLMRRKFFDVYRASVPDEYFFIVYSMVITGAVIVLKWDRLFPDRQDYDNLAVLPISMRQIFSSGLIALLLLAAIFAVDINWAACIIFPYAVTSRYDTFAAYFQFLVAHTSAVVLASLCTCFGLLSILGITLLLSPQRYLRTVSLAVRIFFAVALVGILGSAFSLPRLLLSGKPPKWSVYLPSVWFLDLHQYILGRGAPFTGSGIFAVEITFTVLPVAIAIYSMTYYRQFTRIPEQTAVNPGKHRDGLSLIATLLEFVVVRTAFQRASYRFALKTIFRSERHCLLFGAACGIALFVAAQILTEAFADPVHAGIDSRMLSIPLTLAYFIICSLRLLYDLPTERDANWIFKATVDRRKHNSRVVGLKLMLTMVVPWLFGIVLPLSVGKWGWNVAVLHTGYVLIWSVGLAELLLAGFRKIPFTCMHVVSKDRVLVMLIVFMLGYSFFSTTNAVLEMTFLTHPARIIVLPVILIGLHLGIRAAERDRPASERDLIFEDRPRPSVQILDLTH
jgi:hypothetical protein